METNYGLIKKINYSSKVIMFSFLALSLLSIFFIIPYAFIVNSESPLWADILICVISFVTVVFIITEVILDE